MSCEGKHTVRASPGKLSHNWRKSNLMQFVNLEHKQKMYQLDKVEAKMQHYLMSPLKYKGGLMHGEQDLDTIKEDFS